MASSIDQPHGPLQFQPLEPIGVEVFVDLREPFTAPQREHFTRLFYTYGVVLLRGQQLTWEQQADVMGILGPVLNQEGKKTLDPEAYLGRNPLSFHSDLSFAEEPYRALSLHALDVVPDATSTIFADGVDAYRRLPDALKSRLAGLQARAMISMVGMDQLEQDKLPQCVRPAVLEHRVTGEPILYVTEQHTVALEGLPPAQGEALMRELAGYLYAPERLYEHRWRNGDILLWDNIRMQHARRLIPQGMPRRLQRVTGAELTFEQACPEFTANPELARLSAVNSYDARVNRWTQLQDMNGVTHA